MSSFINLWGQNDIYEKTNPLKGNAKWKKTERFERRYETIVPENPGFIFPLLCPVQEYLWLNGWKTTMLYSETGFAEQDGMFIQNSGFPLYKRINWYIINYEPDKNITFLIVVNRIGSIKFVIDLIPVIDTQTKISWTYLITSHGKFGSFFLKKEFSQDKFNKDVEERLKDLVYWVQNREMRHRN